MHRQTGKTTDLLVAGEGLGQVQAHAEAPVPVRQDDAVL